MKKWGSGTGLVPRLYVWSGWELLGETDLSGTVARRYTQHPEGIDFPLAMREGSTSSYFHLDGQGNVYLLTDTGGTRRSEYRYRAWGDRYVTGTGEAVQSPFTYKGREEDRETGLVYLRHRYYSPRLERFVNQDPIGIDGGLNVYAFGGLSPVESSDPMGLISPCTKVITRNNGEVVGEEYNWQGCEWIFELWRAMTSIQSWGWEIGLRFGVPGLDPFGGGPRTGGTGTTGTRGQDGDDDEDDQTSRTPQQCFDQSTAPVRDFVSDFQGEILAGGFAVGVRVTAGHLLQVRGSQVAAYHGMRRFGTRSGAPFPSMRSFGGALLRSAAQQLVGLGGLAGAYLGTTFAICHLAPDWL